MGNYIPVGQKGEPTVDEALNEAERDHMLDCPPADLSTRIAASTLDAILVYLAVTGLNTLASPLALTLENRVESPSQIAAVTIVSVKIFFLFFYFVWSQCLAGGSPGKLLLGLRIIDTHTGHYLSPFRSMLRLVLSPVFFLTALFKKDHRGGHDILARSTVKRVRGKA